MKALTAQSTATRGELPAILWHLRARQWYTRIGYHLTTDGQRIRSYQYHGDNQAEAILRAAKLQNEWQEIVSEYKERKGRLKDELLDLVDDGEPYPLPVWPTVAQKFAWSANAEELEERGLIITTSEPKEDERKGRRMTLEQAKDAFLSYKRQKIGLPDEQGIKDNSFNCISDALKAVFNGVGADGEPLIDTTNMLDDLTCTKLESLKDGWMRKVANGKIAKRTAVDYLRTFRQLLNWCHENPAMSYRHPQGIERIFRFRKFNPRRIAQYDPVLLKQLLASASERVRLYILMALNLGYYQCDIATLQHEHLVPVDGELYITRKRERTSHQNDFETTAYVWPEVAALLQKHAAPRDNPYGHVLLNEDGRPLRVTKAGKAKICNISTAMNRLRKKLKVKFAFKQFRKIGASYFENNFGTHVQRLYRAATPGGTDAAYVADDFRKLTVALKRWREVLKADGVI